ncbi:MAG: acyl-CoA thioesterase [Bacteroidia bacterium]|jgi:acyl-CoA thioester hydrolase|nr:acyl-CoA thioesterase [Bacteroidia bacterium]
MYLSETKVRVRYAETDKMSYVYYGNYASYFEVARVEALRDLGMSYRQMEEEGFMLPVLEYKVKYFKPALYDDLLTIRTKIPVMPSVRIVFQYEIFNAENTLLTSAETTLVFIERSSGRPCKAPAELLSKLASYYNG